MEVGPGLDPGVEKPTDTKRCSVGSALSRTASALIACLTKHNGGAVKEDPVKENTEVPKKGLANSGVYTENSKKPGAFAAAVTNYPHVDIDVETDHTKEPRV